MKRTSFGIALAVALLVTSPCVVLSHASSYQHSARNGTKWTTPLLYVANQGNNSITVYAQGANGNAAPIRTIAGPNTQLSFGTMCCGSGSSGQLSQDAAGNLWVANATASILIFAHGATGNVAPIGILGGPLTGLVNATAVTVDKVTGKIFVFNATGNGQASLIRFPPGAVGNQAPFAATGPYYNDALQITSDSTGNNVIAGNIGCCESGGTEGILTLPKQFPNNYSPQIPYQIYLFADNGVVDDPTTGTYLASRGNQIYRFAEDTTGAGSDGPGEPPPKFTPLPVSIINNVNCPGQLALGSQREIFVAPAYYCTGLDAVYAYRHDARGHAVPIRTISGPATLLNTPAYIYAGI